MVCSRIPSTYPRSHLITFAQRHVLTVGSRRSCRFESNRKHGEEPSRQTRRNSYHLYGEALLRLKVGCCGYPIAMKKYFQTFRVVELQSTFYNLPKLSTVKRWREIAPEDFEFSMKAWQVITHPVASPSWRKTRLKVKSGEEKSYGFLRLTEQNLAAWAQTMLVCKTLGCRICVVQTPPSFEFSEDNVGVVRKFLGSVNRDVRIAWEPRGSWSEHESEIRELCKELGLVHVVDLLRRRPSFVQGVAYIRLHGLNPREYDYKYHYTDNDLVRLLNELHSLEPNVSETYMLFNNVAMLDDARRFLEMASTKGFTV
jgi:uncharacterized protein YecE (DUF72 family)